VQSVRSSLHPQEGELIVAAVGGEESGRLTAQGSGGFAASAAFDLHVAGAELCRIVAAAAGKKSRHRQKGCGAGEGAAAVGGSKPAAQTAGEFRFRRRAKGVQERFFAFAGCGNGLSQR